MCVIWFVDMMQPWFCNWVSHVLLCYLWVSSNGIQSEQVTCIWWYSVPTLVPTLLDSTVVTLPRYGKVATPARCLVTVCGWVAPFRALQKDGWQNHTLGTRCPCVAHKNPNSKEVWFRAAGKRNLRQQIEWCGTSQDPHKGTSRCPGCRG